MNNFELDIDLVNHGLHERSFLYPGDFGPSGANVPFMSFHVISEWRDYLLTLRIRSRKVPLVFVNSYNAALRTLLLAWVEPAVIKPAELQVLRSLEAGLRDVYFQPLLERERRKKPTLMPGKFKPGLGRYLDHMVAHDGLTPEAHSPSKRDRGNALDVIRNALAHGDVFDGLPWGGLFEAAREIMEHAFRNHTEPPLYAPEIYASMGVMSMGDPQGLAP